MITLVREFAREIHRIGAFKDKTKSPDGKGFKLKLHQINPTAPLSPFYLDFRMLRSFPTVLAVTAMILEQMMDSLPEQPKRLADVPTAATPIVTALALRTSIGMVTPREAKTYGTEAAIDGVWKNNDLTLVIDDLVTKADSKLEAIGSLELGNKTYGHMIVTDVFVLCDRQQGGREQLAQKNYRLTSAFTSTELLEYYKEEQLVSNEVYDEIVEYWAAQKK